MNLKKAKLARRFAREVVEQAQLAGHTFPARAFQQNRRTGVVRNDPNSERGLYLHFKRERATVKRGAS